MRCLGIWLTINRSTKQYNVDVPASLCITLSTMESRFWFLICPLRFELDMTPLHTHSIPAEPLNPQINSRLQSQGAMYSLYNTTRDRKRQTDKGRDQLH